METPRRCRIQKLLLRQHQPKMEKLYTAKTRPGADCGSDHDLFIAIFRLKLKKEKDHVRMQKVRTMEASSFRKEQLISIPGKSSYMILGQHLLTEIGGQAPCTGLEGGMTALKNIF
ncbi:craniofacial development protein 2-like isoform X5 [Bubalus kerabau]|uniref:craniofacial development protein 2-like isoform X5 n=1 Tax=Bubalus carabanensis TaxID=3119969 RepID=UPI00244EFEFE|nr:craniofacial development protein 2-like isoform X5 [Bubalus carabanensis]